MAFSDMLVASLKQMKAATPVKKAADTAGNGGSGTTASPTIQGMTRLSNAMGSAKAPAKPKRAAAATAPAGVQKATKMRDGAL